MAVSFIHSLSTLLVASILCSGTDAGLAASYLAAPAVAAPLAAAYSVAAPIVPAQGVLRTAYSQVVGRSYAPSFVPVSSSIAYAAAPVAAPVVKAVPTVYTAPLAAPVVKAVPTAYAAAPVAAPVVKAVPAVYATARQLVAGPVLKTVRPYAFEAPVGYAAPAVTALAAGPAVRAAVPAPAFAPSVFSTRLAPLPPVGVAPTLTPAAAVDTGAPAEASLPGVFDARSAAPASRSTQSTFERAFVTAFGSQEGIRLVGQAFEGAPTNVDIARAAPAERDGGVQQARSAATQPAGRTPAPAGPENFGVQQQQQPQPMPFNEYGLPVAAAGAPVNP